MLMHSGRESVGIVPASVANASNRLTFQTSFVGLLSNGLLWIPAAHFLVRMRHMDSSPAEGTSGPCIIEETDSKQNGSSLQCLPESTQPTATDLNRLF